MLCEKCAAKMGYSNIFEGFGLGFDFDNLLGSFFANNEPKLMPLVNKRCDFCGASFEDISSTGKVGCAKCYTTFYDRLLPSIQRIHGRTAHVGRTPAVGEAGSKRKSEIEQLKAQLQQQVQAQTYEECARLRDRIHQLEHEETHHE
jgi:protein arginine kinase activator